MKSANSNHTLTPPVPHHSSPPCASAEAHMLRAAVSLLSLSLSHAAAAAPPRLTKYVPCGASQSWTSVASPHDLLARSALFVRLLVAPPAPIPRTLATHLRVRVHGHGLGHPRQGRRRTGAPGGGRRLEWALPRIAPLRIAPLALCRFPHSIRLFADTRTRTRHTRITRSRGLRTPLHTRSSRPTPTSPPRWSWDTLGSMAFAHTGQATPYSAR